MGTPKFLRYSIRRGLANRTLGPSGGQVYPPVYQYNFDGIDDYFFTPKVNVFINDVVGAYFTAPTDTSSTMTIVSLINSNSLYCDLEATTGVINFAGATAELDGVPLTSGVSLYPTDGQLHHLELTSTGDFDDGLLVATSNLISNFLGGVAKDIGITRSNPTDQYPDLFWPIDDGPGATIIRQTVPHTHKIDGTESFDSDGATWIDYETEAAPQYVGVTGYETLAERAALSGLSEHNEAIASCREGILRNGDFRFGDNGDFSKSGDVTVDVSGLVLSIGGVIVTTLSDTDITAALEGSNLDYEIVCTYEYLQTNNQSATLSTVGINTGVNPSVVLKGNANEIKTETLPFTSGTLPDSTSIRVRAFAINESIKIYSMQIRKVTSQQVLSPYVNNGTPANFNDERWERV